MQLGLVARRVFPELSILSPIAGEVFYVAVVLLGLRMWGFGLLWLWFAVASFAKGKFLFNLGWWAFTFPIGRSRKSCFVQDGRVLRAQHRRVCNGNDAVWKGVGVQVLRCSWDGECLLQSVGQYRMLTVVDSLLGRNIALADGIFTDGVEVDHEGGFEIVGCIDELKGI